MRICVVTGSRADYGLLTPVIDALKVDSYFNVRLVRIWNYDFALAYSHIEAEIYRAPAPKQEMMLVLGDRFEILAAATAAHLHRVPIAHIAGGDVTLGSYDDAMRDCISRMACVHFTTSDEASFRLMSLNVNPKAIFMVGNLALDFIRHGNWKRERPINQPYVVVSYQCETIDGTNEIEAVIASLPNKYAVFLMPNQDYKSDEIKKAIEKYVYRQPVVDCDFHATCYPWLEYGRFLNLLYHCDEFIGNSSAMLYEAPELGVKCRMIGKRQQGRVKPHGDGYTSERIVKILKDWQP